MKCLPPRWKPSAFKTVEQLYSVYFGRRSSRLKIRPFHLLYANASRILRTGDRHSLFRAFESDLELYVAEFSRSRVFLHAGAVGWRRRAIVVPGESHSGKTCLVSALVRAGATYLSDEYAVLDKSGRVHPYPIDLGIRRRGSAQTRISAEDLGGQVEHSPLPVSLVVLTRFRRNARWRPRSLPPGHAVLRMLQHAIGAQRRPGAAMATLHTIATMAPVLVGPRGDATTTARRILEYLDSQLSSDEPQGSHEPELSPAHSSRTDSLRRHR
jgi:hypothetical protein